MIIQDFHYEGNLWRTRFDVETFDGEAQAEVSSVELVDNSMAFSIPISATSPVFELIADYFEREYREVAAMEKQLRKVQ